MNETPQQLSRPLAARVLDLPPAPTPIMGELAPAPVIEAAIAALDAGKTHYTDRPGILPLREQIAARLKNQYGVELSPEAVTITCGITEARFVALTRLVQPGTAIYCAAPDEHLRGVAALIGSPITHDPAEHISVAVLREMPSADVLARAQEQGWWLIYEVSDSGDAHPAQDADLAPKTVSIGDFDLLPGWRVGWMAGSSQANKLRAYKQSITICTTSVSQWAAVGLAE